MNEFFSFSRFTRLFIKHSVEHFRTYLMAIGVLAGVMILGGSFIVYMIQGPMDAGFQTAMFAVLMPIAGSLFTATIFADMGDSRKAIPALTLPASVFEKYIVAWLYSFLLFILVYTGVFYLVLLGLIRLKHWAGHNVEVFTVFQDKFIILLVIFSLLHAISMYGAILFEKLHFIKTAFCFLISFGALTICNTFFLHAVIGRDVFPAVPFGFLNFMENGDYYSVSIGDQQSLWILAMLCIVIVLFWTGAYFRLKEKQV